jgi:LL-diaminopimelate aminotransferase
MLKKAERLNKIPPYLFMELRNKINAAKAEGIDVISLAIGDPVEPTPAPIIEALAEAARDPENHRYPTDEEWGMKSLREEVCKWYGDRYESELDADEECLILIGSKEGIHHFGMAMINPGDTVLVTDPGYPGYKPSIWFSEAEPYAVPMSAEHNFLPDLDSIPADVVKKASAFYLNYPNNPTGAVATPEFLKKLVDWAKVNDIAIAYDNPYIDIVFDGEKPLSIMSIEGAKDVAVEFNSFSKPFNMTGWRLGMAVGCPTIIKAMAQVKSNTDSGVFNAVQYAGIKALQTCGPEIDKMLEIYARRRKMVVDTLNNDLGWNYTPPKGTFYLWVPVPEGMTSVECAAMFFEKAHVVVAPGSAYGEFGEGYIRFSLTVEDDRLVEAMERIKKTLA